MDNRLIWGDGDFSLGERPIYSSRLAQVVLQDVLCCCCTQAAYEVPSTNSGSSTELEYHLLNCDLCRLACMVSYLDSFFGFSFSWYVSFSGSLFLLVHFPISFLLLTCKCPILLFPHAHELVSSISSYALSLWSGWQHWMTSYLYFFKM